MAFGGIPIGGALHVAHDPAPVVDEEGPGQALAGFKRRGGAADGVEVDGKIFDPEPPEIGQNGPGALGIDGQGDDREPVAAEPGLKFVEGRHFVQARRAPGRPQVQQHHLA